jgi:hypothetical protein
MNKEDVLESMTWEEFLFHCDVSDWGWSDLDSLTIVDEREDFYIAEITVKDILDQPDISYEWTEDNTLIVDWGVPTEIINPDDDPPVYLKIWKEPRNYEYRCDGQLYTNIGDIE